MSQIVVHPATQQQLDSFGRQPSHALLLIGTPGIGKYTLAQRLAEQILGLAEGDFAGYPYGLVISPDDKGTIGIDRVRELERQLKLKVPSRAAVNRFIIIENSQALGAEAQNALLKTLEEPPQGTVLVLTVPNAQDVLPTIASRSQQIVIARPDATVLTDHFVQLGQSQEAVNQALAMTGGLPGLTHALLTGDDHPLKQAVARARQLLAQSSYERLLQVDELAKDRQLTINILFIVQQMAHVSLQKAEGARAAQWQRIMQAGYEAEAALAANAQPKLVLDNFLLQM